jgi:hypothetical protein
MDNMSTLYNDEEYLKKKFVTNHTKNVTTAKFMKDSEIVGVGFCDIGEHLKHATALLRTISDAFVGALAYHSDDPKTLWNQHPKNKEGLGVYFSENIDDLKSADTVIIYDMFIPISDVLLAKESSENFIKFNERLELYGKAYHQFSDMVKAELEKDDAPKLVLV